MLTAREEAIMEEKGDAQYLTEGNMVQLVRNIFGATDTSAGELHWLFLRMVKEPKIQEKIQKEIDDNIGSAPPTYKDRARCPFTVACLLETLRCHPVLPLSFPHKTTKDTRVGGVFIPKDTGILYNAYGGNRDPKIWDDPEEFRPERFIDPATGHLLEDAQSLLTFGMGSRICPGKKLAHVDMFYILVRLMQRLSCSAPAGQSAVNLEAVASSLIMQPIKQNIVLSRKN
uniref:Putative cytochrome p450 cyp2 subfamily protein n=1 Tax=Amblyomma triste TaxID=251400 RepID=A0A023GGD0_AMBTT